MARPKPDPELVAYALAKVAAGWSYRDIAAHLKKLGFPVGRSTIARWQQSKQAQP